MDWQAESWTNWEGNQHCNAAVCIADDLNDLRLILQNAKSQGRTVRVANGGLGHAYSASFSGSAVVSNEGGIIVQIPRLNQAFVHQDGSQRITAQAGMLLGDFVDLASRHGLALQTAPVPLFIQIGGAVALSCHGCGNHGGTISDLVVGMEILKHDGTLQKITKEEHPDLLKAAQVNLGALGIMYTVTLQCTSQYKLHAIDEFLEMEPAINGIRDLVTNHDYVELFWIPFTSQVWVKRWNKRPWDTPSRNLPGLGNRIQQDVSVLVGTQALELLLKHPRWTPFVMNLLKRTIWTGERIGPPSAIFHYQQKFPRKLWDLSYSLPVGEEFATFKRAWELTVSKVRSYQEAGRFPMNFLMHIRFLDHSDGYLAPACGEERKFMYEAITYIGSDHQEFFDQIERELLQLGGRPHWGKTYSENLDFRKIWGENLVRFDEIRRQMDPEGRFLNPFLRGVFSASRP